MTSNILAGERRWTSARRGGMTVLGKVAVPKPINLPSQRLENHGLDPNVEIVPKGTLSWGSKSSSSALNAWGSSTLSPQTDGGSGSPSHLSPCPSSGGTGTRPSTAGSDRATGANTNAWGSNSRPSSAGALTSNQSSLTSLRPLSAETRPGSSQLSRFAEPPLENSGAWGAAGTAEKLGVASSKNDGFSLTSGDFPTLGSEKDNARRNSELQGQDSQGRPGSSSSQATAKDGSWTTSGNASINSDVKSETANSWRRDNPPYNEDGMRPSVENWPVDPPPYNSPNIPPPHYDAWHGPPVNNPGGVWYRRPPGGPPYGAPVPHGGFPMEPFHYYRPQIPVTALANQQPVPPPGVGPRGHLPKNGDMYRPHMPDAYVRPRMPIRPGFFPSPTAYESYYGPTPPMIYCNSHERDIPFMEMTAGPSAFNRHSGQSAPDNSNFRSRPCGYSPAGKPVVPEQVESSHSYDTCGPYKVLLKQHDGWDDKHDQNWNESGASYLEDEDQTINSSWDDDWQGDYRKDDEMKMKGGIPGEEASVALDIRGSSSVTAKLNSNENVEFVNAQDEHFVEKSENVAFVVPEGPAAFKDSSLIQKIEGLNAKVRASDGRQDVSSVCTRDEQRNKLPASSNTEYPSNDAGNGPVYLESSSVTKIVSCESGVRAVDKSFDASVTTTSRRSAHSMHSRPDHRGGTGRLNVHEADEWQNKSLPVETPVSGGTSHSESSVTPIQTHVEPIEKSGSSFPQGKDEGEAVSPIFISSDSQLQRAKMRELAKLRVKQRQEEEEEREREQKAKALAKLEELNQRTQTVEVLNQKAETGSSVSVQNKLEESQAASESTLVTSKSAEPTSTAVSNPITVVQTSKSSATRVEKLAFLVGELPVETQMSANRGLVVSQIHLEPSQRADSADSPDDNAPNVTGAPNSKQKRMGHKHKQKIPVEKNSVDKLISASSEAPTMHADPPVDVSASIDIVAGEMASTLEMSELSGQPRRKINRGGKNKHKTDATSSTAAVPSLVSVERNVLNTPTDDNNLMAEESALNPSLVQSVSAGKDSNQSSELHLPAPNEDTHGRVNNQWRLQHSRRMRNQQGNRSAEKFLGVDAVVWAPVRSHNKADISNEVGKNSVPENTNSIKNDQLLHNNPKNKRAEMERYIPKPVAKEMAQQGSLQQPVALSTEQTASEVTVGRPVSPAGPATWKGGPANEAGNGDVKQNKLGKVQRSWRQRGSAESAAGQSLQERKYDASNSSKNVPKLNESLQLQKSDASLVKEQYGWDVPENSESSALVTVPTVKDQGVRGKRHSTKGQKGMSNTHEQDQKKIKSDDDMDQYISRSTSHWQPKLQASTAPNQGAMLNIDEAMGVEGGGNGSDPTFQDRNFLPPQQSPETIEGSVVQPDSLSEKSKVQEAPGVQHPEAKGQKEISSLKGLSHSLNQVSGGLDEQEPSSNMDFQHEKSAFRFQKNSSHNSRIGRGHKSRGHWGSVGQDNKQHYQPAYRDRQRNTTHYEYQPVGPHNNNKDNTIEQSNDASHNTGPRSRDRGQNHSRRGGGNFYGRQSSTPTA